MAKPFLTQCCCCCGDLRIGTVVLLILFMISNIYTFISSCTKLSNYEPPESGLTLHVSSADENSDNPTKDIEKYVYSKETLITQLVWSIVSTVVISIGLYGVFQKKHMFILPWIVVEGATFVLAIIVGVVAAILLAFVIPVGYVFLFLLCFAIPIAIFGYMWCVVYSYYAVLQEENSRGLYDKQPYRR